MPRHRGTYDPSNLTPYEISRSKVENFIQCPACFWMDRVKGIKFPSMPKWLLNTATDTLLKKDFDKFRNLQVPHPLMEKNGLKDIVPFHHKDIDKWRLSTHLGLRTEIKDLNLIFGGGLDDVWIHTKTNELIIVDYKSTAGKKSEDKKRLEPIDLEGSYKKSFKRQMEMYQWILRQNGFTVKDLSYFLYVNGDQHFAKGMLKESKNSAIMNFEVQFIPYIGDDSWVFDTLQKVKKCLEQKECPKHSISGFGPKGDLPCEYLTFLNGIKSNKLKF